MEFNSWCSNIRSSSPSQISSVRTLYYTSRVLLRTRYARCCRRQLAARHRHSADAPRPVRDPPAYSMPQAPKLRLSLTSPPPHALLHARAPAATIRRLHLCIHLLCHAQPRQPPADVSIRQQTSAYVSIRHCIHLLARPAAVLLTAGLRTYERHALKVAVPV